MKKMILAKGDVVQINPEHKFGGMLVVVSEPKTFGCQGYLLSAENFEACRFKGRAFVRLKWEEIEFVGKLHWIEEEEDCESSC